MRTVFLIKIRLIMIRANNIIKQYGSKVVSNIADFTINDGEILGLVGNNGAGKTTLFRMILDLLKADNGHIELTFKTKEGDTKCINVAGSEEWKPYTGAYIDEGFLIDFLTPEEYFAFLGKISGLSQEEVNERLKGFEQLSNGELFGQKKLIRNLSAGNKQKVGIMAAFLNNPQIVILDEPFNFLDPTSQNVLKRMIAEYNKATGATIIISSHNLSHTVDISTRIVLLENGEIIRDINNIDNAAATELESYFGIE